MHLNWLQWRVAYATKDGEGGSGGGGSADYQGLYQQQKGLNESLQGRLDGAATDAEAAKKAGEERDAQFAKDKEELDARVKGYEDRDKATADKLYEGLSDESKAQVDMVKGSLALPKYLEYLGTFKPPASTEPPRNPPIRPRSGGDPRNTPTKMDQDTIDTLDFLGVEPEFHAQSVITRDTQMGYRMALPIKLHRGILAKKIIPGQKLRS